MKRLRQKENGCVNFIWQCFVPVMVYYIIHNAAALFGLSVLQILKDIVKQNFKRKYIVEFPKYFIDVLGKDSVHILDLFK